MMLVAGRHATHTPQCTWVRPCASICISGAEGRESRCLPAHCMQMPLLRVSLAQLVTTAPSPDWNRRSWISPLHFWGHQRITLTLCKCLAPQYRLIPWSQHIIAYSSWNQLVLGKLLNGNLETLLFLMCSLLPTVCPQAFSSRHLLATTIVTHGNFFQNLTYTEIDDLI